MENSWNNCETSLDLTWSKNYVNSSVSWITEFKITEAQICVPVVTLSTEDNVKLLKHLEPGFQRTINWNNYHLKFETFPQNRNLNDLIDPRFQGVNRLFVLPFENETDREVHTIYYLPTEEILLL